MSKTFRSPRERSHNGRARRRKRYEKKMGLEEKFCVAVNPNGRFHKYISVGGKV